MFPASNFSEPKYDALETRLLGVLDMIADLVKDIFVSLAFFSQHLLFNLVVVFGNCFGIKRDKTFIIVWPWGVVHDKQNFIYYLINN